MPAVSPLFAPPHHLHKIVDLFRRIEASKKPVRAVVSVPPRHGKTETVLHAIAWWLRKHPERTAAYVSYAADIARSKSRQARDYAGRAGVSLRDDSAALHEWRTPDGGGLLATGVGGPLTGHGVSLLVVDDPLKNRSDADSPTVREKVHQWFTSTAMTRVEPGGSVLVVHTRWHKDDLIGRLLDDEEVTWEEHTLPAIDSEGRALWPERWPIEALEVRRAEVGEHDWQSLYQQHPVARKGRIYPAFTQATHVVKHADLERLYKINGRWSFRRIVIGVDFGWSHPGAAVVIGQTGSGAVYVLHEERHQHLLVADQTDAHTPGWLTIYAKLRDEYHPERFVADPSEPGNIAAMRRKLAARPVVEAAFNNVTEGIRRVSTLMAPHPTDGKPRLFVSDRCKGLISELESYSYLTLGGVTSETPQEVDDDLCDATRYGVAALALPH